MTALRRTEAGELFRLGGMPSETTPGEPAWLIKVAAAPDGTAAAAQMTEDADVLPDGVTEKLQKSLAFAYPYMAATAAPSKQTATGRKGRDKDAEAAENAREPKMLHRSWRSPGFLEAKADGREYGNALHAAMQYIRYEVCEDEDSVRREVDRMVRQGFLTGKQGEMVFFLHPYDHVACLQESLFHFSITERTHHHDHLQTKKP